MRKYSAMIFTPEDDKGIEFYLYTVEDAKALVTACLTNGYEVRLKPKESTCMGEE